MTEQQKEAIIDKFSEKIISRKFLAWIAASFFLMMNESFSADNWIIITSIYIGGQTVIDAVEKLKKVK